jgi:hypothetical protein
MELKLLLNKSIVRVEKIDLLGPFIGGLRIL